MSRLILAALAVSLLSHGAGAFDCEPIDPSPEIEHAGFYVDTDFCQVDHCAASTWVFQETNGFGGLQRHDHVQDQVCGGQIPADHVVLALYAALPRA